ncbi:MAG TPA: hypothetical protein VG079_04865 [Gaiellaceae bacterium]|nr:hypothetical protein [Gaiellaceae bacterium]
MPAALALRRLAVVWASALSGVLIVAAFFLDPDIGASGRELAREYAENPGRIQLSALSLRFAFALLVLPSFALIRAVRERGAWLANVAGVCAVLGMTTLPGFLLVDFYDVAIYGELGGDAWQAVTDRLEELPGATFMFVTGFFGFFLTLPLALLAAWRARLLPWWPALVVSAGQVAAQAIPGGFGLLLMAASLVALTYALRQVDWGS